MTDRSEGAEAGRPPHPRPRAGPNTDPTRKLTLVRGEHRPYGGRTEARLAVVMAALASASAGIVHAAASEPHFAEWRLAGAFFLAMAFFQIAWAIAIVPFWNVWLALAGVGANLGFLGLWALSRARGMPFGPHAGVPEAVGLADALTAVLEAAVVVGLLWSLLPRERHGVLSAAGYRYAVVLAVVGFGSALVPGVGGALSHGHGGEGHSHDEATESAPHEEGGHDHGTESDMEESSGEPSPSESSAEEDHTHAPGEEHD